jgi:hypothetical protein
MANIDKTDVVAFIGNLVAFMATIPSVGNVLDRRRSIANRQEYADILGIDAVDDLEIKFCETEFLRFEDSPDEGDDDCPIAVLTFGIHLFHEFADLRSDSTNSSFDYIGAILDIRKEFLEGNREFAAGDFLAVVDPVTMPDFSQFGNDDFSDAVGHIGNLNLTARFYDE